MLDSTTASDIPLGYPMVMGYDDGPNSQWSAADWARFASSTRVHCAVAGFVKGAHVYDCERGDFTIAQLVEVIAYARTQGDNPTGYFSASQWDSVLDAFAAAAVPLPGHGFLVASWPAGFGPADKTIPTQTPSGRPALAIGHQYAGSAWEGHHYDASVVADYWPGVDPAPRPTPSPPAPLPPAPFPRPIRIFVVSSPAMLTPITEASTFEDALALAEQTATPGGPAVSVCTSIQLEATPGGETSGAGPVGQDVNPAGPV